MKTLTMRLQAPIASFGNSPRMQHRLAQAMPTHNAIVGMIACAMGLCRDDDFSELKTIQMKVLSLTHGEVFTDFQTIRDAVTVDGSTGRNGITYRYNFPDYDCSIEIKGDDQLIGLIEQALKKPHWQLYIGRRSNVLSAPVLAYPANKDADCLHF